MYRIFYSEKPPSVLIYPVHPVLYLKPTGGPRRPPAREATVGFEPTVGVLQTPALPLGDVAEKQTPRFRGVYRAGDGIRTHDLLLGKETFYH